MDERVVRETANASFTFKGSIGQIDGIIDSQTDVGGWPVLEEGTAPVDSDLDGMPDQWELKNKLNPNDPSDANQLHKSGYTLLETYLNEIVNSN